MDKGRIDVTVKKLKEINKTITQLDPAIRAAAFDRLAQLYFDDTPVKDNKKKNGKKKTVDTSSKAAFFGSFKHDQPSDALYLIIAWLYSQHGVIPLTASIVRKEADAASLTIPDRPDLTMKQAKSKGKPLFRKLRKGYELTVSGQKFLKKDYSVKKGRVLFSEESEE